MEDLVYFMLAADSRAKDRRMALGKELGIGYGNAKQMISRLNNYGIDRDEFVKAIQKVEKEIGVK